MSEWKTYRLGDVTTWSSGGTPSKAVDEFWNGDIPWISASSMGGNRYKTSELKITKSGLTEGSRLAEKDTILLLVRGSILHQKIPVGIAEIDVAFNQDVKAIKPKPEFLDSWFLLFWFMSMEKQLLEMVESTGIGAGKLDTKLLQNLTIDIPPKPERDKITAFVKSIDDKLILNTQTNQTLESIAQAIFKSWFVDFEPVKAKMAVLESGGTREQAELAAMGVISGKGDTELAQLQQQNPEHYQQLTETAALFPSAMMESELGEIPEGWEVALLSSKIDVLNGFAFKSEDYVEQGTFVLRTKNFSNGIAEPLHDDVFLPPEFLVSHAKYLCEPFDYHLIMVGASVGNRGIIFPELLPALRNQNMWCFRPKNGSGISKAQSKLLLDQLIFSVSGLASGSAREFFRKGDFENQKICFGSEAITEAFRKIASPLYEKQSIIFSENIRLSQLRDSLLPKLLSGEIDLSESALTLALSQGERELESANV